MNSNGCVYMYGFSCASLTDTANEIDKLTGRAYIDFGPSPFELLKEPLQQLKQTVMEKTQKPFEMQITFPANRTDIFTTTKYGVTVEVAVVSAERAKEIYDVIGRQLAGLRATEPKKPAKKSKKQTGKKQKRK